MNTVVFAHRKAELPKSSLLPNKMELFDKLEQRGIRPVVSLGAEAAFDDTSVEAHELVSEDTVRKTASVALADVGAIANRLDRSFKKMDMPDTWNDAHVATLNENELRSLVFRKHRVQDEVLTPLDLGIPTALVEAPVDAAEFIESNPSEEYIIKPTSGTFSKGVYRLAPEEVIRAFSEDESKLGTTLLQPAYDFSHAFPNSFEAYDHEALDDFEQWSKSNATKELRMYGFYTPDHTDVFPVARAMKDGVDNWFFVDPATVPEKLFTDTRNVLSRAAQLTSSQAIYAALDIAYGSKDKTSDPDYHIVELNGRMPYLVGYDKHAGVADTLRDMKADQIQRVIQNKGVK